MKHIKGALTMSRPWMFPMEFYTWGQCAFINRWNTSSALNKHWTDSGGVDVFMVHNSYSTKTRNVCECGSTTEQIISSIHSTCRSVFGKHTEPQTSPERHRCVSVQTISLRLLSDERLYPKSKGSHFLSIFLPAGVCKHSSHRCWAFNKRHQFY